MDNTSMKNIVVLKDLPSNVIEEVFVILKQNKNLKKIQYIDKKVDKFKNIKNENIQDDYIIKEAEMIVSEYINKLENNKVNKNNINTELNKKYKKMKLFVLGLVFLLLISIFC